MRSHFNKWNPLTLCLNFNGFWPSFSIRGSSGYLRWKVIEDLVSSWNPFFLPSDVPWLLWTALLDAPCEPFHRPTQMNRQSLAFCGENPFKVPYEIHSHSRASCWWEVSCQIHWKQYMLKKPTKWRIKCFSLADSSNGYIVNVLPYTGRETLDKANFQYQALPQPAQVVLRYLEPYLDQGWHVFTDQY